MFENDLGKKLSRAANYILQDLFKYFTAGSFALLLLKLFKNFIYISNLTLLKLEFYLYMNIRNDDFKISLLVS